MEPEGNLWHCLLLLALIGINAFFSMSHVAVVSLNDSKVHKMAQEGNRKAVLLEKLIGKPARFLSTIQLGTTVSSLLAAVVAAAAFAPTLYLLLRPSLHSSAAFAIALLLITLALAFLSLVLGEHIPRRIAAQHYEPIAFALARPLSLAWAVTGPFVTLLSAAADGFLRLIGIDPDYRPDEVTEEEIRMMIDVGNESGNIEESDKEMLNNIFEFDDRTAYEMMSHRTEIVAIDQSLSLPEIIDIVQETGYSRIPVYDGDLDSIVGILYVKDLLALVSRPSGEVFDLSKYLREPLYVLETTSCKKMLKEFQEKKIHMAIVVDEYGGTSGLITMEDLLESIVGNIQDEYDDEEEDISQTGENAYLVEGLAPLEDVIKFFDLPLEEDEEEFETIAGYIINRLGYIPGEEEHPVAQVGNIRFTVLQMDERRIAKLQAELLPVEKPAGQSRALPDAT